MGAPCTVVCNYACGFVDGASCVYRSVCIGADVCVYNTSAYTFKSCVNSF